MVSCRNKRENNAIGLKKKACNIKNEINIQYYSLISLQDTFFLNLFVYEINFFFTLQHKK